MSEGNSNLIHIFGAGIAGLAAAVYCQKKGYNIKLYEAANYAGGRCRSFHDSRLDCLIDNGNHLILGGNLNIFSYLEIIGAEKKLLAVKNTFPFVDIQNGEEWTLRPGNSKLPLWIFLPGRRVPGTNISDYLAIKNLTKCDTDAPLANYLNLSSTMYKRFWEPLCNAVLNTETSEGSTKLLPKALELTLFRGRRYSQPFLAPEGLSETFVDPAIDFLVKNECEINFGARIKSIFLSNKRVDHFTVGNRNVKCGENDHIICALPPKEASALLPEITVPTETRPIINLHYRPNLVLRLPQDVAFLGIINGLSQWVFRKNDVLSVTISNAVDVIGNDTHFLAKEVWREITAIIQNNNLPLPPYRVLKERRATIAQTPRQNLLRPNSYTKWENLHLAGDWTNTGLPATIESAIQSGKEASEILEKATRGKAILN